MIGKKILHYNIVNKLGEGGMFHIHPRIRQDEWLVNMRIPISETKSGGVVLGWQIYFAL
jgi:hypothetical protein